MINKFRKQVADVHTHARAHTHAVTTKEEMKVDETHRGR